MKRIIKISENQYNSFIFYPLNEGIDYKKQGEYWEDTPIDFSINQDKTDRKNTGSNSVDTRVFGTKNDILYGDGTSHGKVKSLTQNYNSKQSAIKFYQSVIEYVRNGRKGEIYTDENLDKQTYTAVMKWFENGYSDNRIMADATKTINRLKNDGEIYFNKYNRVKNTPTKTENDKIARYNTGTVPSTNIKYIALFSMTDFNFSDAIKHGTLRQNGNTDKLLGINKSDRQTTANKTNTIGITYDGKYQPNITQNFSLNNVKDGHYKQQFGMNGEDGYSSVTQFIDKSIIYASYALKQENYQPQFIVAAPSSSKFNDYYCQNLSRKLGIEYVRDFFQRNLINVKFDEERDVNDMKKQGFSDKDILDFSNMVKNVAYNEIAHIISTPIRNFCNRLPNIIEIIRLKTENDKYELYKDDVINCIIKHAYNIIVDNFDNQQQSNITLMELFFNSKFSFYKAYYSNKKMMENITYYFNLYEVNELFKQKLGEMKDIALEYVEQLQTNGYKLRFDTKKFKITQFPKQYRPFLHNVYIVADANLNKNGELFKRYQNAKFLIFDEDINSGATLKCVIDALQEKLPDANNQNILCLVNAYSASGF